MAYPFPYMSFIKLALTFLESPSNSYTLHNTWFRRHLGFIVAEPEKPINRKDGVKKDPHHFM
jgi:hypothetical protein